MKNFISKKLTAIARSLAIFIWLPSILFTSSCNRRFELNASNHNNVANTPLPEGLPNNLVANEIIILCGNSGVDKSSLCNSIFQQNAFRSDISVGGGTILEKQEYIFENRKYIDVPGLSDVNLRNQAALEIEKVLKENNNYKIVFVATLEVDRIKPDDVVTINTVCDAIKVPFKYGIIFNKVANPVIRAMQQSDIQGYLTTLRKKPSSIIVLKHDEYMLDNKGGSCFQVRDREKLVHFIARLQANVIPSNKVQSIDVLGYEKEVREVKTKLQERLKQIEEEKKIKEEDKRRKNYEADHIITEQEGSKQVDEEKKIKRKNKRRKSYEVDHIITEQEGSKQIENEKKIKEKDEGGKNYEADHIIREQEIYAISSEVERIEGYSQPYDRVTDVKRITTVGEYLLRQGTIPVRTYYNIFVMRNTYCRTKITNNNGTITYSNWELVGSEEVLIDKREKTHFE